MYKPLVVSKTLPPKVRVKLINGVLYNCRI